MQIDIEHLMNMAGGDPELAEEVLEIFRNQAATWGRMLNIDSPPGEWADAAHTLKGAALSIGAHDFAETCRKAETLGRADTFSRVEAATALSDVKTELIALTEAIAKISYALSRPGLRASKAPNS